MLRPYFIYDAPRLEPLCERYMLSESEEVLQIFNRVGTIMVENYRAKLPTIDKWFEIDCM